MQSSSNGPCQADDLEGGNAFHSAYCLRTRVCDPEVLKPVFCSADAAESFVRLVGKDTMSHVGTHSCSALYSRIFSRSSLQET